MLARLSVVRGFILAPLSVVRRMMVVWRKNYLGRWFTGAERLRYIGFSFW